MSILEKLNAVKDTVPHYWPISAFISHNPLKGFEHLHFKEGLKQAQHIYGSRVYMDSAYYINYYHQGKIEEEKLKANISYELKDTAFKALTQDAQKFMIEVSPQWDGFKNYEKLKSYTVNEELYNYLLDESVYTKKEEWVKKLTQKMTLYEIHDALFDTSDTELIEKDIIEFTARFLDQAQTTLSMMDRDLGMFGAFKLYEEIDHTGDAQSYVEKMIDTLKIEDIENYFLTHILKLHGWAGYIKYRSEDEDYYPQQIHPSTLMDFMAIRLHFEHKYISKEHVNNFEILKAYIYTNTEYTILKLLQSKGKLTGKYVDAIEDKKPYKEILDSYVEEEIKLNALQIEEAKKILPELTIDLVEFVKFSKKIKEIEGYIWLKSLEDSYIKEYVETFTLPKQQEKLSQCASIFCLDVRSEVIRRNMESIGDYSTYGIGGFLGLPIKYIEFDTSHELSQAPAVIKPENIVFEIPIVEHDEYNSKKNIQKTTKKVLNDLKNNPYTPFILVESIGWIFGVKLFGKTFFPKKTEKLFKKFKPKKPKTTFTLDKLSPEAIKTHVKTLHIHIIEEVLATQYDITLKESEIDNLWEHLVYEKPLIAKVPLEVIEKLHFAYDINPKDYQEQSEKLSFVGFTLEEQAEYAKNFLEMVGLIENFPNFVTIIGHGSLSDNNPFESALDCGACSGSISLPNARAMCMIINKKEIRDILKEKNIDIPKETIFIPGLHTTTTDEITFFDTDKLEEDTLEEFAKIQEDFKKVSKLSREERIKELPHTNKENDIFEQTIDWSEPRPEWGLAKNLGVFAGPRESIKHVTFDNRFFMHSYDHKIDNENADILTRIFDGPLIVGEWISLQYYFSTTDNKIFGAGSKVYHNIVSKVGVYNGNYSDLKIGLPTQSVLLEGEAYHEPVRLLTFMEAPLEKVGKAVENSLAQPFILNEWIRPVVIDKEAKKVYSYENGDFIVIKELN